jgi:hypothetical protein
MAAKEVNGYQLREALKRWKVRKDVADKQFKDCLYGFKDDEAGKPTPQAVAENYQKADFAIAKIQELQQAFNAQTQIEVGGKRMTLSLAIKLVGGAGRLENMWRSAATDTGRETRYGYDRQMSRKADEEYARRRVKVEEAIKHSDQAAQYAASLRSAIATANSKTINVPADVPAELFE